jgi:hypothetical protein
MQPRSLAGEIIKTDLDHVGDVRGRQSRHLPR